MATVTVTEEPVTQVKKTVTLVMSEAEAQRVMIRLGTTPRVVGDDGNDIAAQIDGVI
jgi:hypothetical protein